jgi:hypothetical protein
MESKNYTQHELINHLSPFYEHRAESVEFFFNKEGTVEFNDLWFIFKPGQKIVTSIRDRPMGGIIKAVSYSTGFIPRFFC